MIFVSDDFKTAMKQPVKELQAFLECGDKNIRDADDLISFKVSGEGGLCKTVMRKFEAKYLGEHNLLGQWASAGFGVKLSSGAYEYLNYGSFLVNELTFTKDTGVTSIVAYDKMINTMKPYEKLDISYPVELFTYTQKLCEACGLELGNTSFEVNGSWSIESDLWENISDITYRDIFTQIAQATASVCMVGNDDKIYFKPITSTGEKLTYDNMFKLKVENKYGEINSVVLSRAPQEDNVFLKDDISIQENGLTEFRIENNEILDKNRKTAIIPIFNALKGVSYYPFETTTEGLGWYEIGDSFNIENDTGDVLNTTLFNFSITVDGSLKETLKASAETQTQTQYQYATSIAKSVKKVELIVDKQNDEISSLIYDMREDGGIVNDNYSQLKQRIDSIELGVQNSGGSNLIKNSVMFACNNGAPTDWELSEGGTLTIKTDTEALGYGGLSGHSFSLKGKTAKQRIGVNVGEKSYYTFSTKIKKGDVGSCYVKLYNSMEEHIIKLPSGEEANYEDYEIKGISPKANYFDLEFYASADSDTLFTDSMLVVGEYKKQWSQAGGEIMNTKVNVNVNGLLVKSSIYQGDYTIMTPLEFAGYSNINGTMTRVFTLNKDVTEVKKLKVEDEIKMSTIKVIPVNEGDLIGWAFVPTSQEE